MTDHYNTISDGQRWYFDHPPESIDIDVVSGALCQLARFGGQGKLVNGYVYSVGQHSIKVAMLVPTLTALLHDAHEMIIGDATTPFKRWMKQNGDTAWPKADAAAAGAIARAFGTDYPVPPEVREADVIMCMIEGFDLMPDGGKDLLLSIDHKALESRARTLYELYPALRPQPWSPRYTDQMFKLKYKELTDAT